MTTLAEIARTVCAHWNVSEVQLYSRTRCKKRIAQARCVFYWLARSITGKSWQCIADHIRRHHATVYKCANELEKRMADNGELYYDIMAIRAEFV